MNTRGAGQRRTAVRHSLRQMQRESRLPVLSISTSRPPLVGMVAVLLCALLLSACSAAPRGATQAAWSDYLDTLGRLQAGGAALEPGGAEERRAIARFQELLSDLKAPDFAARVGDVYADDVFFNDTLKTLNGVGEVEAHLLATAEALEECTVEFVDLTASDGDYYFRWVMTVRHQRLARGEALRSVGMTHVRFDAEGKVVLHQDFWDSTGGFFEHVPALGWLLRRAKARL